MNSLQIEAINEHNIGDVNKCDGEFIIDATLVIHLENNQLNYSIEPVSVTTKRYAIDNIDISNYIGNVDKIVYLAYVQGRIAGQIILRKNWNKYAYVEDIAVDVNFRRQGIGKELISKAKKWAVEHHLRGIMLETQNNNVGACRFYESCGFQLEGLDVYLYKGINPETNEIALYWYLVLGEDEIR